MEKHAINIIDRIYAERVRQVQVEEYSPRHDNDHDQGELSDVAAAYALGGLEHINNPTHEWSMPDWVSNRKIKDKPRIRQLEIAAALIVAEIERIERANEAQALECVSVNNFNSSRV